MKCSVQLTLFFVYLFKMVSLDVPVKDLHVYVCG